MKKFLFAAPLALAGAALLSTPAAAASNWSSSREIKAEITQLDRQIDYAQRGHGLSQREATQLARKVDRLQQVYRDYARGGFNRAELVSLGRQVDAVKYEVARQTNDRNGHADRGRYDDHRNHR